MTPRFSSELLLHLLRAARASDHEICGILRMDGDGILRADPAANVASDPATRFEIDPAALFAAYRDARRPGAPAVAGWYHSHPSGDPDPSPTDAAQAAPDGRLWLIAGRDVARLWRAVPGGARHGRFDPVAIHIGDANRAIGDANRVEKSCEAVQMDAAGRTLSFAGERDAWR